MLAAFSLPICDARAFRSDTASRLPAPDWPLPHAGSEFVRCFGSVEQRRRGGNDLFPDETFYSNAHAAVKLIYPERYRIGRPPQQWKPYCAYRRLFVSGSITSRFELGLTASTASEGVGFGGLTGIDLTKMVLDMLELPVEVVRLRDEPQRCPLWRIGSPLARLYCEATTPTSDLEQVGSQLVAAGDPLVLIEYEQGEVDSLPSRSQAMDAAAFGGASFAFLWLEYRRKPYAVWFLCRDNVDARLARRLRLGLIRMHAEHQVLKQTMAFVTKEVIQYEPSTKSGEAFDSYLNRATRLLLKDDLGGYSQAPLREILGAYDQVVHPEESELLHTRLEAVRRQVRMKVKRYSEANASAREVASVRKPVAEPGESISVFVSYSHVDAKYLEQNSLLGFISGLERERFDFWHDDRIATGELWDDVIRKEIERADIALILVSQAFLNSRYCQEVEIANFLEEKSAGNLRIFPVILSPCDWKTHAWLSSTQFLPRGGKTIETNYANPGKRKELFLKILEELRELGRNIRKNRIDVT